MGYCWAIFNCVGLFLCLHYMCHLVNAYEVKKAGMVCLQCKNCVTHGALYKSMYIYLSWLLLVFFQLLPLLFGCCCIIICLCCSLCYRLSATSQVAAIRTGSCPPRWYRRTGRPCNSWLQQIADGTSHLLAFVPSGPGLAVVVTWSWVNATDLCRPCDLMIM